MKFLEYVKSLFITKNLVITGDCRHVEIKNGKIFINGKKKIFYEPKVNLIINGNVAGNVSGSFSTIKINKGVLGNVNSTSGNITIDGDVGESVQSKYGKVQLKRTWRK